MARRPFQFFDPTGYAPSASWNGRGLGVALGGTRRKPVLIAAGVIVLGVLFAELDRGSQKTSETEFVAVGVN
jgi:hypothetical protein